MTLPIKKQTVLITGSARGLGAEIAKAFHREGATIIINYRKSEEKAKSLSDSLGNRALLLKGDVRSKDAINEMSEVLKGIWGLPIIINCAKSITKLILLKVLYSFVTFPFWIFFENLILITSNHTLIPRIAIIGKMGIKEESFNSGTCVNGTVFKTINVNKPATTQLYPGTAPGGNAIATI